MEAGSTARPRSKAGVFATAFRNRSLLLVEVAWLAFNGAEWGVWLTLMVWAYTHGGAAAASLIVLVQLVPCIFISPYLGAVTDRARAGRVLFVGLLITGLGLGGPALATAVLAACTLAGAFMVVRIPGPRPLNEPGEGTSLAAEVRESVAAVWRAPAARTLVGVVGSQYILVGALDVLYVVLAITTLGLGESGAGYLNSAFGAGGLIGAFALLTVAGLSRAVFDVTGRILLQPAAPPQVMGQVFALLESLMDAGLAVGAVLVPVLVGLSGVRAALVGTALLFFVLVALAWRRLRTIDDTADVPQVQIQLLRSIPIFSPRPAPELEGLACALVPMEAIAGATLITEGEPGDCFYAIADGRMRVTKRGQDVATLSRGDGFGEIALIQDVPRHATVVALTDVNLYSLEKEPFVLALTGHAPAARAADDLVAQRLGELGAI